MSHPNYDIWLYDDLHLLVEKMQQWVPNSHYINGWTNGSLCVATNEVFGILPIPINTCVKAALQPSIPASVVKRGYWYLALQQGTQFAVIAVKTTEEKQLFSKLMRGSPVFNHNNQNPDWKQAVQIWNCDYANGKTIFYKVEGCHAWQPTLDSRWTGDRIKLSLLHGSRNHKLLQNKGI
jgi:hypothetical protein